MPRSLNEIYDLNRALAQRFKDIFEDHGVPVIPSLGNNDIYREYGSWEALDQTKCFTL